MAFYSVSDCSVIELDKHHSDRKGNLTVVENNKTLPFDIKRVYYIYDVPGGESVGTDDDWQQELFWFTLLRCSMSEDWK